MQGKADMLVAKRTLSALIVVSVVVSAFAGLLFLGQPETVPARTLAIGDLILTSGVYTIENIDQPIDGDVDVTNAQLVVRDGSLSIISNSGHTHSIHIGTGGSLILEHGTVTTYLDQISPWPFLTLTIDNGGLLTATDGSLLMFPGAININLGAQVVLTDTTITSLPPSEVSKYVVGSAGLITLDSANDGPRISVSGSTLELFDSTIDALPEYPGDALPAANLTLAGASTLLAVNSYIGVDFGPALSDSNWHTHNVLSVSGTSVANLYGCSFEPYNGVEADRARAVEATPTGSVYFYRWLNVTVGDEYGVPIPGPIPGARVSGVFTGSESYEGLPAFYFWSGGTHTTPDPEVLDYMGKNASNFDVTDSNGIARIPYLTDMVLSGLSPYSLFVGSYRLTGFAIINSVLYQSTETFSFPAYPAMSASDQNFDVTVEIAGVSAPSPDQSRWLVVPVDSTHPSLTINNMTYYHAGDVIVAADGTLTLDNTIFMLVQAAANQRTIFVDGTPSHSGQLIIQDSTMTSALPIDIIVKGEGILRIVDSDLIGVNIVAQGNAQIILDNVTMDGRISTSWDSNAMITISDSELVQSPILAGNSRGGITNTSLPSIGVTDNAYAEIFRWIHVLVYDGAGQPLPGALVTATFYVSPPDLSMSATTDLMGVAKVKCLGTNITAAGKTYRGNYIINGSYNYPVGSGSWYFANQELSVGVMPYTEPLGRNATYATMTIPGAKPDLAIHASPVPVTIDPASPLRGTTVNVSALINNDGVSAAYNVQVNFYDNKYGTYTGVGMPSSSELFATTWIPFIPAGGSAVATVQWYASYPRDPAEHHIVVIADPTDALMEINEDLSQQTYIFSVQVQVKPDLEVRSYEIRCLETPEIDKIVNVSAIIWNIGDAQATSVLVEFYDGTTLIGSDTISSVNPNSSAEARILHAFTVLNLHTIWVSVDPYDAINETDWSNDRNNNVSRDINVYDHPDLQLSGLQFKLLGTPVTAVNGNTWINITADVWNNGLAPVVNPVVTLWINVSGEDPVVKTIVVQGSFAGSFFSSPVLSSYKVQRYDHQQTVNVTMVVNQQHLVRETDYLNNIVTGSFIIRDDRPDLSISSADIAVKRAGAEVQSGTYGNALSIVASVKNLGGRETTFGMKVSLSGAAGYNFTIVDDDAFNISANATDYQKEITIPWAVSQWVPGDYSIWVSLDPNNQLSEPNEANNIASIPFAISPLEVVVSVTTDTSEYKSGKTMIITALIQYTSTGLPPVKGLPGVTFFLTDSQGNKVPASDTQPATTDNSGKIEQRLIIPLDLESGSYSVSANVAGSDYPTSATVQISSAVHGGLFPFWVWLVIIAAVVAVVVGFTLYTYIYGLGKLVECGECGAFIPAASKRCPKCGVEFEAGTMKCSECGAWIPADSTECPNCGVKFVGEVEDEADYMERMREQYDEMVSKYREIAKTELGKKFTDREFDDWWRNQPGYIVFDDWLAKEEEKKKEGPVACPVCGSLNPKEATVCHKCGTVFAGGTAQQGVRRGPPPQAPTAVAPTPVQPADAGAQQQPPGQAPRMVIRRPIDRKVVPKKIIKTPLGEETTQGGDETEDQQ